MLTAAGLLWTEIGASCCWMVVSGLLALLWTNRARRGYSSVPVVVFTSVFAPIGALLTAHALAGQVLTTAGGVPLWAFFFPIACLVVALAALRGYFSIRAQVRAEGLDMPHSPAGALPLMLMGSGLFGAVGALFFWMLAVIH